MKILQNHSGEALETCEKDGYQAVTDDPAEVSSYPASYFICLLRKKQTKTTFFGPGTFEDRGVLS